ncbi:MAG: hypothetical protein BM563_04755 [Bacteroidetes bacterium MedPE-SWsnd-G1]|nr:MAG: hypothetical protein BM563_04755 [Bacteroidetes bacterium MedPE-SWsnd-G1]
MEHYIKHKLRSKKPFEVFFTGLFIAVAIVGFIALFGYVTMRLWNWLMPEIFDLTTITYWQAIGLLILAKFFFGGLGSERGSKKKKKTKDYCNDDKPKRDFSKWKLYDKFWEEEGNEAFNSFVKKERGEDELEIQPDK